MTITEKVAIINAMAQEMSRISEVTIKGFNINEAQASVIKDGLQETTNRNNAKIHVAYINGFRIQTKDPGKVVAGAFVRWYDITSEDGRPSTFWGID